MLPRIPHHHRPRPSVVGRLQPSSFENNKHNDDDDDDDDNVTLQDLVQVPPRVRRPSRQPRVSASTTRNSSSSSTRLGQTTTTPRAFPTHHHKQQQQQQQQRRRPVHKRPRPAVSDTTHSKQARGNGDDVPRKSSRRGVAAATWNFTLGPRGTTGRNNTTTTIATTDPNGVVSVSAALGTRRSGRASHHQPRALSLSRTPAAVLPTTVAAPPHSRYHDESQQSHGENDDHHASTTLLPQQQQQRVGVSQKNTAQNPLFDFPTTDKNKNHPTTRPKRFQPPSHHRSSSSTSRNIVHQVMWQSLTGRRPQRRPLQLLFDPTTTTTTSTSRRRRGTHTTTTSLLSTTTPWTEASWIAFSSSSSPHQDHCSTTVTAMRWDATGDYLAVALSSGGGGAASVAIYDWHSVTAADLQGRRQRQRQLALLSSSLLTASGDDSGGGEGDGGDSSPPPPLGNGVEHDDNHNNSEYDNTTNTSIRVEPILQFPLGQVAAANKSSMIQILEWNPYNPHELVIGMRASNGLYSLDLEAVNGWQSCNAARGASPLPCRELRCYEPGVRGHHNHIHTGALLNPDASVCFVRDDDNNSSRSSAQQQQQQQLLLLSAGSTVFAWNLGHSWTPGAVPLLWKFQYKEPITSLTALSSETVLLGSSRGRLAVLNWKRLQRTSFSCKASPTLVQDWIATATTTDDPGQTVTTPSQPRAMSILHVCVVKEPRPRPPYAWRLVWITGSGWVLSSRIEMDDSSLSVRQCQKTNCTLHFCTRPIQFIDNDGEPVMFSNYTKKPVWNIPANRIPLSGTDRALVWERVPDNVVQRLPHCSADDRVLDSGTALPVRDSTTTSTQPSSLCWLSLRDIVQSCRMGGDNNNNRIMPNRVPLATKRAGPPTCLAVHPDHEWIVVGTSRQGIYLLNARREPNIVVTPLGTNAAASAVGARVEHQLE